LPEPFRREQEDKTVEPIHSAIPALPVKEMNSLLEFNGAIWYFSAS